MEPTIVWQQIRRCNQNLRLHNLVGLVLLNALGWSQFRYLRNCFLSPQTIDFAQLLQVTDPSKLDRDFVTFTSTKALDTGYQKVSKSSRSGTETTTNKYAIALVVSEKALLVAAEPDDNLQKPTFTGTLATIDSDVQSKIVDPLMQEQSALKGRLLPVMLETGDYRFWAYFLMPLLLIGGGILSWNLYQAQLRSKDPRKHPLYKLLARHGDGDTIATEIDRELRTYHNAEQLTPTVTYITPNWRVHPDTYGVQATQLDRLMWIYKKVTKHSVNFIPTGKSYQLFTHDNFGREQSIKMSEQQIDDTLGQVNRHAPWAVVGFSDEIKSLWDKQRDEFYKLVAERKQESWQ